MEIARHLAPPTAVCCGNGIREDTIYSVGCAMPAHIQTAIGALPETLTLAKDRAKILSATKGKRAQGGGSSALPHQRLQHALEAGSGEVDAVEHVEVEFPFELDILVQ